MSTDALRVVQVLFSSIWSLTTSWYIPGTNVTPMMLIFFFFSCFAIIRLAKKYLLGGDD